MQSNTQFEEEEIRKSSHKRSKLKEKKKKKNLSATNLLLDPSQLQWMIKQLTSLSFHNSITYFISLKF